MATDFRGYVQSTAPALLGYVGNDGGINAPKVQDGLGINNVAGAALYGYKSVGDVQNKVDSLYKDYTASQLAGSGGGGSGGAANTDAQDLAYLDSQDGSLRAQLESAQHGLSDGLTQIGDTFNQATNRTNQDKATADTGFNTQRTTTTQDKLKSVDSINSNGKTLADSVRRILGLASGANSSAFQVAAPSLIARDMTTKRTGVNDTYKRNYDTIDSSQNETDLKFSRALEDLFGQKKQKEEGLRSGVLQQEQDINSQLGQNALTRSQITGASGSATRAALAPFSSAIADRQSKIDSLFSQFRTPFQLQDTTPVAANTASYQVDPTTLAAGAGAGSDGSGDSPYLQALLKKFQGSAPAAA